MTEDTASTQLAEADGEASCVEGGRAGERCGGHVDGCARRGAEDASRSDWPGPRARRHGGSRTGRWSPWCRWSRPRSRCSRWRVVVALTVAAPTHEEADAATEPALRRHRVAVRGEHVQLHPGHDRRQRRPVRQQHQRAVARHDEPGSRTPRTSSCSSGTPTPVPKPSINGAALEKVDELAKRADVLVAVRVTVTDLDGNNAPSKPYRLRVTVQRTTTAI